MAQILRDLYFYLRQVKAENYISNKILLYRQKEKIKLLKKNNNILYPILKDNIRLNNIIDPTKTIFLNMECQMCTQPIHYSTLYLLLPFHNKKDSLTQ